MSAGGDEYLLRHGSYEAVATQVGGGLRRVRHDGRDLVRAYAADEVRPRFRGALLAPWPNRLADGRYRFAGDEQQLALTEPERGTALHGLVCWVRFDLVARDDAAVTLRHRLVPQPGYPFALDLEVRYSLDDDGLSTTVVATNAGGSPAPYGVAPHPYLVAPSGRVDDWTLRLPADEVLEVTSERLLPVTGPADGGETRLATGPVAGTERDFRTARRLGSTELDHAFTGVRADPDGRARVVLHDPTGAGVQCSWDPAVLPWLQVHTGDLPDEPDQTRRGLAVEPMTCPPDAFNSGRDLVVLEPGASHTASWTLGTL